MTQLTGRDYKKRARTAEPTRWREFGVGVLVGATAMAVLFSVVRHHRHATQALQSANRHAAVHHASPSNTAADNAADNETRTTTAALTSQHYDFYQMLPHFEVVVPDKEHPVHPNHPTAAIDRPGLYVLQAGSYRRQADAQRVAKQLAHDGIGAKVQRVSVDTDIWYRVRVGPIRQLAELNRLRHQLTADHVDSLAIRIGN